MNLNSIRIENFRQFYGKQAFEFAQFDSDKNVTLIHGFNGAGKTALLNAFIWCLFGKNTPDFEAPDRLESEKALAELELNSEITVSIELSFSSRSKRFIAKRSKISTKIGPSEVSLKKETFNLWEVVDGDLQPVSNNPSVNQQYINVIIPAGLYPFFFFNGERVEWLASPDAYDEVEKGITMLLDVKIYERAFNDLNKKVNRELSKELKSFGDEALQAALEREEDLVREAENHSKKIYLLKENIGATEKEIEEFEKKQSSLDKLKELTDRRETLRKEDKQCKDTLKEVELDLSSTLSKNGYLAFGLDIIETTKSLVDAARERGDLPAKIKPQFVDDLIASGICICKRSLNKAEVDVLVDWKSQVGLAELEEAINQACATLPNLEDRRKEYFDDLDKLQLRRSDSLKRLREIRDDLDIIEKELGDGVYCEDAVALADRLKTLNNQLISFKVDKKYYEDKLKETQENLELIRSSIKKLKVKDERAKLIKLQKESVEKVAAAIEQIYLLQKEHVRNDLNNRISKIWNDAAIKAYEASVTDDFRLKLTKTVAGFPQLVHGASTGEKQVLALSFVGSLVEKAKENMDQAGDAPTIGIPFGGEYPLVMDSAFGSLEDEYRGKVAEWIPSLAHQVVILVSKTQWRMEVEEKVRPRIGKEYILELHTQQEDADRDITIEGQEYPYVVTTYDPAEQTIIREVKG